MIVHGNYVSDEEAQNQMNQISMMIQAQYAAEKRGEHKFVCPLCGGKAHWARSQSNKHLNIRCGDCGYLLME